MSYPGDEDFLSDYWGWRVKHVAWLREYFSPAAVGRLMRTLEELDKFYG